MHPRPVGTHKLHVRLDQSQKFTPAIGIVRRFEWVGMGLEFTQLHPVARQFIDDLAFLV